MAKAKKATTIADTMSEEKNQVQLVHGGIPVGGEEYLRRKGRIAERVEFCVEREKQEKQQAIEDNQEPDLITNFPIELSALFKDMIETFSLQSVYADNSATDVYGESLPGFLALRVFLKDQEDICDETKEWHSHANMHIRDWFHENGITLADTYDPEKRMDLLGWGDHPEVTVDDNDKEVQEDET